MQVEPVAGRGNPEQQDPLGVRWVEEFTKRAGRTPQEADRQDRLFSMIFPGSGPAKSWTTTDRDTYQANKETFWEGKEPWPNEDLPAGYDRFQQHITTLASHYGFRHDDRSSFARAAALIWGGIAYEGSAFKALTQASIGDHALQLQEGADDWQERYVDDANPAHHWVAAFLTGFIYGAAIGVTVNAIRDIAQYITAQGGTLADIELGSLAAEHGAFLAGGEEGDGKIYERLIRKMREELRVK